MSLSWKAPDNVWNLVNEVKAKHHPCLHKALFAVSLDDSKSFIKDKINLGNVVRFSDFQQIWMEGLKYDFCIQMCSEVWHDIFNKKQREALIDLQLSRCSVELEPQMDMKKGRRVIAKDNHGLIKYSGKNKLDSNGNLKWVISALDLPIFTRNAERYGLWIAKNELKDTILLQMLREIK